MATVEGWEEGGVFTWVSNTLGEKWGFAAISFGYLQIAVGFIPMLYFVLGTLSYILNWPALNTDPTTKTIALVVLTNTGGGGGNMSFLIALALTVVIYLCSYFLLFLGYINLVRKHPEKKRTFNIPGGTGVKITVASVGLIISTLAFIISFFPPSSLPGVSADETYVTLLLVSFLIVAAVPFIIYALHDKRGKKTSASLVPITTENAPKGHFFMHPRARSPHHLIPHEAKETV